MCTRSGCRAPRRPLRLRSRAESGFPTSSLRRNRAYWSVDVTAAGSLWLGVLNIDLLADHRAHLGREIRILHGAKTVHARVLLR